MRQKMAAVVATMFLVLVCSAAGWAATVSGTISYAGSKSGRVYVRLTSNMGGDSGYGVSLPAMEGTSAAFQIRGVPQDLNNNYTLSAYIDTQSNGLRHANDPAGQIRLPVRNATVSGVVLPLADPAPVAPEAAEIMAYQGTGGNMVIWRGYETNDGAKKANDYRISWSIDGGSTVQGYKDIKAADNDFFFHAGGTTGHRYMVTAIGEGVPSSVSTPWATVATRNGGVTVSGTVNLSGVTATGPLAVVMTNESVSPPIFFIHAIPSPSASQTYTFSNIPAGSYQLHAIVDMNNNGTFDAGDIAFQPGEYMAPVVTVSAAPVTGPTLTIAPRNADAIVRTSRTYNSMSQWESYSIGLQMEGQLKRPVNISVSRQGSLEITDIGFNQWGEPRLWFPVQTPPQVGDTYSFSVQYADGTSEPVPLTAQVNAVLNSLPQPVAPVGLVASNPRPTFSWTAPAQLPAGPYAYSLWLGGRAWWNPDSDFPSTQLSAVYNFDGSASDTNLPDGDYSWAIQVVDEKGNSAQYQANFTMTSDPTIGDFSPVGGPVGTTVTISGINFNPNPGSNVVRFNGVQAAVTAASTTSLTVTVPNNASTGNITVGNSQSKTSFFVGAQLTIQGRVQTMAGANIAGAVVAKSDNPSITTTTAGDGTYTLGPFFEGQDIDLKITKSGYVPTYTSMIHFSQSSLDIRLYPSHLYSLAEYGGLSIPAGQGALFGQVLDQAMIPYVPIAGVQVGATSFMGGTIPVTYYNGTSFGGSSTYTNGIFIVPRVNNNDTVNVTGLKSWWNFTGNTFRVRADSVTEGGLFGALVPPMVSAFFPTNGVVGTSVTISGSNFSSIRAENTVRFTNDVIATVTAASTNSLTVTVPYGAVSGGISVTTPGGTSTSAGVFTMNMPSVSSTTPDFGPLGTVVTVSGNFPDTNENNYRLLFGSSQQAIDTITSNSLTFTIPVGVDPVINWSLRYSNQQIHFETFEVKNHLTLNIVGSGSVNDSPNAYTCASGTCNGDFAPVVTLTLVPTPSNGYVFKGWSGACVGTGDCVVPMSSARNVTATFELQGHVKIKDKIFYSTIQNSFNAAVNNDVILIQSLVDPFVENLLFNRTGATVKAQGGWDVAFGSNNNSFSVVDGYLKVMNGTLKVEKLKIR